MALYNQEATAALLLQSRHIAKVYSTKQGLLVM
jgi:hypothetical protein